MPEQTTSYDALGFDGKGPHDPLAETHDEQTPACPACGRPRGTGCARDEREPRIGCYLLGGPLETTKIAKIRTQADVSDAAFLAAVDGLSRVLREDQEVRLSHADLGRLLALAYRSIKR